MRTRIKICGLTRSQDVDAAVDAGVDALGFVFYEKSPRYISPSEAQSLIRRIPAWMSAVGLFVNASKPEILRAAETAGLSHIQLHGDEKPQDCLDLGRPVIKALRVKPTPSPAAFEAERARLRGEISQYAGCQAVLLDADSAGFGGSGKAFDWGLLGVGLFKGTPFERSWVLSGGLESGSVGEAIARLLPPCVDVSSGVEQLVDGATQKGQKDSERIRQFVDAVSKADRQRMMGA